MAAWSKEETYKLIEVWGDDKIQAQLEGCKRNQDIFAKISSELSKEGYERTTQQCRDKIKKLKVDYRKIKDKRNKTGEDRYPEWDFFDVLDEILGHKPATAPPVVVNSLENTNEGDSNELEPEVESVGSPALLEGSIPSTTYERKDVLSDKPESKAHSSTESGHDETSRPTTPSLNKGRKRKRTSTNSDKFDTFGELLGKIIDNQKSSERLLLELEEKCLKYEEKQAEREAEQRREEHMFQLQIMQMVSGSFYGPPPMHNASAPFAFGSVPGNSSTMNLPSGYQSNIEHDHTNP